MISCLLDAKPDSITMVKTEGDGSGEIVIY